MAAEPDLARSDLSAVQMEAAIRHLLAEHASLHADARRLAVDADLYKAGLSSLAAVNLMLAIEQTFGFEFAEEQLTESSFASIAALTAAVSASAGR